MTTARQLVPHAIPERRRSHRAGIGPGSWLTTPSRWTVQLLDLSIGGLAFSSPHRLGAGSTPSLYATLGGQAFSARLRVCWMGGASAVVSGSGITIGAMFLPLEEDSRSALQSFLKVSPSESQHA